MIIPVHWLALTCAWLFVAVPCFAYFGPPPPKDYEDKLVYKTSITTADLVVIGEAQFLGLDVEKENILRLTGYLLLYDWSGGKVMSAAKSADAATSAQSVTAPVEPGASASSAQALPDIVILASDLPRPNPDPLVGVNRQILFLKVVSLSPSQIRDYQVRAVKYLLRFEKRPPTDAEIDENIKELYPLNGTEVFCKPCAFHESATILNKDITSLEAKVYKERYHLTTPEEIIKAVKDLCAWRDMKEKKVQLEYLLKLINDNKFYLDNVPPLVSYLGSELESKDGRYVLKE